MTVRCKIIRPYQEALLDKYKAPDYNGIQSKSYLDVYNQSEKDYQQATGTALSNVERALLSNLLHRAHRVVHVHLQTDNMDTSFDTSQIKNRAKQRELDYILASFPRVDKHVALMLSNIEIPEYRTGMAGTTYKLTQDQTNPGGGNVKTAFQVYDEDVNRIDRYWDFVYRTLGVSLNRNNPSDVAMVNQFAHMPNEIAQDLFEDLLKWNALNPSDWYTVFNQLELACFKLMNQPAGPSTIRFP